MLRIKPITDAKAAAAYYSKSDGGYYTKEAELHREWGGRGAAWLGLHDKPSCEQFENLLNGLHPLTGEQLTLGKRNENSIIGWDFNVHAPKAVSIEKEFGDERLQDAMWDAARKAMSEIEALAQTRVRKGGQLTDRTTGNITWYAVEHNETRPNRDDGMPDPHSHIHIVVANATFDDTEHEWKALKVHDIMRLRKYFDRRFNMHFADNVAKLGYDIETRWQNDNGQRKYVGWDIGGIHKDIVKRFSRRTDEIEALADELGITGVAKDKLGATSRLHKRDDMTLDDYQRYWFSKVNNDELREIARTIKNSIRNPKAQEWSVDKAVEYALAHSFERSSVLTNENLAITAMERCMGKGLPDEIMPEAIKQGLLTKDGYCTTQEVLDEENRIIAFAREGKGTMRPLSAGCSLAENSTQNATLSTEQQAVIDHLIATTNRVALIRGAAGTGKTHMAKAAVECIEASGKPVTMLAPTNPAVDVLRKDGFEANTLAMYLTNTKLQQGGVIWLDEAGLVGTNSMSKLFDVAKKTNARVILMGDKKQLGSVERGSSLHVLETYGGLPVAELTTIRRQKPDDYKQGAQLLANGKAVEGFDHFNAMGRIKEFTDYSQVAAEYLADVPNAKGLKKADKDKAKWVAQKLMKQRIIVCPTHSEGKKIQDTIRKELLEKGLLGNEEKTFKQLVPLQWTEAQQGDAAQYAGDEILQFRRVAGSYKPGDRIRASDAHAGGAKPSVSCFTAYGGGEIKLRTGDAVRFTAGVKTLDTLKSVRNGSVYTVKGFTKDGDIELSNDWVIPKDAGHIALAYTDTAYAAQGKTKDKVIIVASAESYPAMTQEAFYVAATRGRHDISIMTDSKEELREVLKKSRAKMSAVELGIPPKPVKASAWKRMRAMVHEASQRALLAGKRLVHELHQPTREWSHER